MQTNKRKDRAKTDREKKNLQRSKKTDACVMCTWDVLESKHRKGNNEKLNTAQL
jgi:hypothetical protein